MTEQSPAGGKRVVAIMFLVAAALGGYAWWYNAGQHPRCREFWGAPTIVLLETAPQVEFLRLRSPGESEAPSLAGSPAGAPPGLEILAVVPISRMPGMVHARHALVADTSYRWSSPPADVRPPWDFGLRFSDGPRHATLVFDLAGERLGWVEGDRGLVFTPAIAAAFRKKEQDWLRATDLSRPAR